MTQPISPRTIKKALPEEVIVAINKLLSEKITERGSYLYAKFNQNEAVAAILSAMPNLSRQDVFDRGYLDFEFVYREAGWVVHFDKPGYNESYEGYWEFEGTK